MKASQIVMKIGVNFAEEVLNHDHFIAFSKERRPSLSASVWIGG